MCLVTDVEGLEAECENTGESDSCARPGLEGRCRRCSKCLTPRLPVMSLRGTAVSVPPPTLCSESKMGSIRELGLTETVIHRAVRHRS